jgi:putative oxidoreductase
MKLKDINKIYKDVTVKLQDLALLFLRLMLAYGFYKPALLKLKDVEAIGNWFSSLAYPVPFLSAYLATATETVGVILLFLGLGIRYITIPLQFVMVVAILTVHWSNGFDASNNGFEIPLYYLLMLFVLMVYGGGKYSMDFFLKRK